MWGFEESVIVVVFFLSSVSFVIAIVRVFQFSVMRTLFIFMNIKRCYRRKGTDSMKSMRYSIDIVCETALFQLSRLNKSRITEQVSQIFFWVSVFGSAWRISKAIVVNNHRPNLYRMESFKHVSGFWCSYLIECGGRGGREKQNNVDTRKCF